MSNVEWTTLAVKLDETGMSWRDIADLLGKAKSTVSDYLRKYHEVKAAARADEMYPEAYPNKQEKVHDNSRILLISDMHIPYHHKKLLPFLEGLKKRYAPTRVICLGDELDKHAMSYHDHDPDLPSAGDELSRAMPTIKEVYKMFPEMDILESNHGSLHLRKAKTAGFSRRYIRGYNEILEVGEGWVWHMDLTIELPDGQQVYFHHGKTSEAIRTSQLMGMSHVCGHYHENFGVKYWANPNGLYWGMNVGCLIDDKALAFAYNKVNAKRPIIGTGLIIDGVPVLEAMPL